MEEYDPETCVTAGALRRLGFPIDGHIPDGGWIDAKCGTIGYTITTVGTTTSVRAMLSFTGVFRWKL